LKTTLCGREENRGFATNKKERLIDRGQLNGDPLRVLLGDPSRARERLGWTPEVTFADLTWCAR
jgi:GDP-D-mannose dehydratase